MMHANISDTSSVNTRNIYEYKEIDGYKGMNIDIIKHTYQALCTGNTNRRLFHVKKGLKIPKGYSEGQTIQWSNEKGRKDKQWSPSTTEKSKD